jgi:hypothetical protein
VKFACLNLGLIFLISACSLKPCKISDGEREALLNLDYHAFDQTLPDGGWRKYVGCPTLTRDLIDAYTARHESTLAKQDWDVLVWHSGQLTAMAGDYAGAIAKMEKTFKPNEKPTDTFLWNAYAKATIAFLKRDRPALISDRKELARGTSPLNGLNLRKVDAFIRCFDSSYDNAYAEKCQPPETNLERIQDMAVSFDVNKPFSNELYGISDFFRMKKLIVVGEMHGTKTVPEVFAHIVASVASESSKTLAILEITQSSQSSIDQFLKTGNEAALRKTPFFTREYQDGRSSKAMVALLKALAKLPNTTVLCMDPMTGIKTMTGQQRDSAMAAFINDKRVGYDHTVVLSGNIHSSTALGTPWDNTYRPMAFELKSMAKDLPSDQWLNILVRYGKVDSWNCQGSEASSCSAHYGKEIPTDYSKAVPFSSYLVWEIETVDGHNASIFIRNAKISLPFMKK